MIKIDTELFITIITSEDGVHLDWEDNVEDIHIKYFKGPSGKSVAIQMSNEFISNRIAKSHMRQLGIDELIIRLFPSD